LGWCGFALGIGAGAGAVAVGRGGANICTRTKSEVGVCRCGGGGGANWRRQKISGGSCGGEGEGRRRGSGRVTGHPIKNSLPAEEEEKGNTREGGFSWQLRCARSGVSLPRALHIWCAWAGNFTRAPQNLQRVLV
jgi:hypothetical protein